MASVRKLKPDNPKSPWVVEYTDAGGKRRRSTPKSGLKKDAERERLRIETELEAGLHTAMDETVTIARACEEFLRDLDKRVRLGDLTKGTAQNYEACLKRGVLPSFGARKVASVASSEVQQWVDELRARFKPRTIGGYYIALSLLLSFAVRRRWTRRNVLRDEPCKLPAKQKRTAIPSLSDLKVLMETVSTRHPNGDLNSYVIRRAIVALGAFGGLRPGEIYGLQWESVDFDRSLIHVRNSLSPTDGLKGPKSAAGVRDVPMTTPIRQALWDVARFAEVRRLSRDPKFKSMDSSKVSRRTHRLWEDPAVQPDLSTLSGFVCVNRRAQPRYSEHRNRLWDTLMRDAGLCDQTTGRPKFTPHALRHAAASLFIQAGLPAMNLKTVIGHKSVSTTYDIYGHLFPEDERTARTAEAIAEQFGATETRQIAVTH